MTEMDFRVNITIEVNQVGNGLAIHTPVPVQLVYERGQWRGECESPPVSTLVFDRMEEALVACGEQVAAEMQGAVMERPLILARITPDDVPKKLSVASSQLSVVGSVVLMSVVVRSW
jgi:hypothetical protein